MGTMGTPEALGLLGVAVMAIAAVVGASNARWRTRAAETDGTDD